MENIIQVILFDSSDFTEFGDDKQVLALAFSDSAPEFTTTVMCKEISQMIKGKKNQTHNKKSRNRSLPHFITLYVLLQALYKPNEGFRLNPKGGILT